MMWFTVWVFLVMDLKHALKAVVLAGPGNPSPAPVMNLCSGSVFLVVTDLASSRSYQPLPDIEQPSACGEWYPLEATWRVHPLLGKDTAQAILVGVPAPHLGQHGPLAEDGLHC